MLLLAHYEFAQAALLTEGLGTDRQAKLSLYKSPSFSFQKLLFLLASKRHFQRAGAKTRWNLQSKVALLPC
jgi:hypothetical protein